MGELPNTLEVIQKGGVVDDVATWPHHLSADLALDSTYTLFLSTREDGSLRVVDGPSGAKGGKKVDPFYLRSIKKRIHSLELTGASLRDQAALVTDGGVMVNLLSVQGLSTIPRRFVALDSGESIPVLVDVSTLPAGITQEQVLTVIDNALDAWEIATSVRFHIKGLTQFTISADTISDPDGRIRIQMHDNFDAISDSSTTVGVGGGFFSGRDESGGIIDGLPFRRTGNGYVVINHPRASLSNPVTLEEVVTHELGHVLGLAHSSETFPEANARLADATMYFRTHSGSRCAVVGLRS